MTTRKSPAAERIMEGVPIDEALDDWVFTMQAANRSTATIKTYATAVRQFVDHQRAHHGSLTVDLVEPVDIRSYLKAVLERTSATTAVTRWGGLLAFFKWARAERLCAENPMLEIERPQKPEMVIPELSDAEISAVLATCGEDFYGVRDRALILLLLLTGMRREEAATMTLDSFDPQRQTVTVMGKGAKQRSPHIEGPAVVALRKYLRHRRLHPKAATTDRFWLGKMGPLSGPGIQQTLQARSERAGVRANPHAWRHTFAHRWLAAGGTEGGLMSEGGWSHTPTMRRYAASASAARGRAEHARLNLIGDIKA
jgi:site-specific recombinase XerD